MTEQQVQQAAPGVPPEVLKRVRFAIQVQRPIHAADAKVLLDVIEELRRELRR